MPSTPRPKPAAAAAAAARAPQSASPGDRAARFLPLLLVLFAGSGCAALIYEIVWYQLLQLVIGSTAVSLGVLLATFMGGLCVGSLWLPRLAAARKHPLRVFAFIELGTAAFALLVLWCMPAIDSIYVAGVSHGLPSMLLRGFVAAICLLPPTILMGASLPAIVRWVESTPAGVSWWGLLYGANIAGAVWGCLWAGYYLLRIYNLAIATWIGIAINVAVALTSLALASSQPSAAVRPGGEAPLPGPPADAAPLPRWPVLCTIALSGFTALGAEVVWTRLLSLLLGATVYAFSVILAVFLLGLGIGSGTGAWMGRRVRPRLALGWAQMFLAAAIAWSAWMIAVWLPNWPINPMLVTAARYTFELDLVRTVWTVLPAAILWGMSFPLALAAMGGRREEDPGAVVGSVYAANTAGGIAGALGFSLVLVPWLGTHDCQRLLLLAAAASALPLLTGFGAPRRPLRLAGVAFTALVAVFLAVSVRDVPGELIAYGRRIAINRNQSEILFTGEGRNSSIAVSRWNDGAIQFHVSGKVEASTEPFDMRLQRTLGHMPALVHPDPHSVLIVGFGAGVTAGSFVPYPGIHRIVICEMEPLVPPTSTRFFGEQNYNVAHDPRTQIVFDDARHFVLTTPEHFDIITSDPIHPWVKGSATLYSREYFQMEKDHLNPGGVVTQWVPLYESDEPTVKSEIATFFDVFPYGTIWANDTNGQGYDVFMLGTNEPLRIDVDRLQQRLNDPANANVVRSLQEVGLGDAVDLLSIYTGREPDLRSWLEGADINTDLDLRLQYLAGLALNDSAENEIYNELLSYRRFPADMFTGSPQTLQALQNAILQRGSAGQKQTGGNQ